MPREAIVGTRYRLDAALDRRRRVWRAFDSDGTPRVLKTGPRDLIHHEFRVLRALDHANIVRVFDCLETGADCFLVLEDLAGGDLVSLAGLAPDIWLRAISGLVDALGYLHGRGLVHRDIKARNVMLDDAGRARLIDFGSAAEAGSPWASGGTTAESVAPKRSPHPVSFADDEYAFACLVHEMLHGHVPASGRRRGLESRWQSLDELVASVIASGGEGAGPGLEAVGSVIEWLAADRRCIQ